MAPSRLLTPWTPRDLVAAPSAAPRGSNPPLLALPWPRCPSPTQKPAPWRQGEPQSWVALPCTASGMGPALPGHVTTPLPPSPPPSIAGDPGQQSLGGGSLRVGGALASMRNIHRDLTSALCWPQSGAATGRHGGMCPFWDVGPRA